jgi:FkbM family methyltransferase
MNEVASPERFVSWAQNFEDVMLWRALGSVTDGFYVDVGAFSPLFDSVTRAFYERGWHGINIDPHPEAYREFERERPRDVNLKVALAEVSSQQEMYFVANRALSTLEAAIADERADEGEEISRQLVDVTTLGEVWARYVPVDQEVHFLKVDVEGSERRVLRGHDWAARRPWIVVVEATRPNSRVASHTDWEEILTLAGYALAYADGLNRFYVSVEHADLGSAFSNPPNVFDKFIRGAELDATRRADKAELELARIYGSRAWRMTGGVRAAVAIARNLRYAKRALWGRSRERDPRSEAD